jgi:hypothetical protein
MKKSFAGLLIAFAVITVSGCASVPMASTEDDSKAKSFVVQPGKANIYLFRDEVLGAAIGVPVMFNGKMAGRTGSKTYFFWEVSPGDYELASVAENTSTHRVRAQAGRNYYIWQEMKMGLFQPRTELQEVDEERGKAGVTASQRILVTP